MPRTRYLNIKISEGRRSERDSYSRHWVQRSRDSENWQSLGGSAFIEKTQSGQTASKELLLFGDIGILPEKSNGMITFLLQY